LTHIVRNSADHGIETPDERKAAGKPEEGMLKLRAFHEGGQVNIEIIDDGGGIDPQKIKQKALEKNVITQEQAQRMSDRELVNLVFAPGFSTAAKVTNVSGRGVGMDVVKTNIEKIGGTVDIQSKHGEGTTLKVKIPLTLAIIPALTVMTGGDRYAIPQVNLLELVLLEGEQAKKSVEFIQGAPVYRLRGHLLPLIYLHDELKVEKKEDADTVNIVVLQADDRQFGLVVEGVNDTEEIVVKPLSPQLKGISAFSGATIMGDGKVALILDVIGLAQTAKVVTQNRERARLESAEKAHESGSKNKPSSFLELARKGVWPFRSQWSPGLKNLNGPKWKGPGSRMWFSIVVKSCRSFISPKFSMAAMIILKTKTCRPLSTLKTGKAWHWYPTRFSISWMRPSPFNAAPTGREPLAPWLFRTWSRIFWMRKRLSAKMTRPFTKINPLQPYKLGN